MSERTEESDKFRAFRRSMLIGLPVLAHPRMNIKVPPKEPSKPVELMERAEAREILELIRETSTKLRELIKGNDDEKPNDSNAVCERHQKELLVKAGDLDVELTAGLERGIEIENSLAIRTAREESDAQIRFMKIISALGIETSEKFSDPAYLQITEEFNKLRLRHDRLDQHGSSLLQGYKQNVRSIAARYHPRLIEQVNEKLKANNSVQITRVSASDVPEFYIGLLSDLYGGGYEPAVNLLFVILNSLSQQNSILNGKIEQLVSSQIDYAIKNSFMNPRYRRSDACNTAVYDVISALGHRRSLPNVGSTLDMKAFLEKQGSQLGWKQPISLEERDKMLEDGYYFVGVIAGIDQDGSRYGHSWLVWGLDNKSTGEKIPCLTQASFSIAWQPLDRNDYKGMPNYLWGRKIIEDV